MKMLKLGLLLILSYLCYGNALRADQLAVVVLSQGDSYHSALARDLRNSLVQQGGEKGPKVYLTHKDFPHPGAWTVIPILPQLLQTVEGDVSWFVFCEERTRFHLDKLLSVLSRHDPSQEMWLGHGLIDKEPTIIHHFRISPEPFQYPLLAAGFAISNAMVKRITKATNEERFIKSIFSKDAMYELALFVSHTPLLSVPSAFCLENNNTECASYPLPLPSCGEPVPNEDIYFAVKTCLKFHKERVPVIQKTWGKEAYNIEFFSDVKDESIPTTQVGVDNVARGHCSKTKAILELIVQRLWKLPHLQWLVLVDDDTLLSVPRLRQLLSCWSGEPVVVGERYGFDVLFLGKNSPGYNFPTGGAGIAIHTAVLPTLAEKFYCSKDSHPDDMVLGELLTRLGIPMVHSPFLHQARPMDYPAGYLATQQPISFHKYWEVDPFSVYEKWFSSQSKTSHDLHTEL